MPAPTIESHNHSTSSGGTTTTIAVSASLSGDVIVVCTIVSQGSGSVNPVLSIAGGGANVGAWTSVGSLGPSGIAFTVQAWYAITSGAVSAATVTITSSLSIDDAASAYVTVAGANTAQPLDQNATLAKAGAVGTASWVSSGIRQKSATISTTTANVLAFLLMGANRNEGFSAPLANSTLTETALASGGSFYANVGVYTAPFTATQTNTVIGSSGNNTNTVVGVAFGITADGAGGGGTAQALAMVLA